MKQLFVRRIFTILALVGLAACVQVVEKPATDFPSPLRQSSVISTSDPDFKPEVGQRVAWSGQITAHTDAGLSVDENRLDEITQAVEQALNAKGYRLANSKNAADYWVHGLIVYGNELNEQELGDILGFRPGLAASSQQYEKGSLLLFVLSPQTGRTLWRSAVQILIDPELSAEQRTHRTQYAVRSLLRPLPELVPIN